MGKDVISSLFLTVVKWAGTKGAKNLSDIPGIWKATSGDWEIEINAHQHEVEGIPPMNVKVSSTKFFGMVLASPYGGIITGVSEDEIITHFKNEIAKGEVNK